MHILLVVPTAACSLCDALMLSLKTMLELSYNILAEDFSLMRLAFLPFITSGLMHLPEQVASLLTDYFANECALLWSRLRHANYQRSWLLYPVLASLASLVYCVNSFSAVCASWTTPLLTCKWIKVAAVSSACSLVFWTALATTEALNKSISATCALLGVNFVVATVSLGPIKALPFQMLVGTGLALLLLSVWLALDLLDLIAYNYMIVRTQTDPIKFAISSGGVAVLAACAVTFQSKYVLVLTGYAYLRFVRAVYRRVKKKKSKARITGWVQGIYTVILLVLLLGIMQGQSKHDIPTPFELTAKEYQDGTCISIDCPISGAEIIWKERTSPPKPRHDRHESEPICLVDPLGIPLIDYAFAAQLAYFPRNSSHWRSLKEAYFPDFEYMPQVGGGNGAGAVFYELRHSRSDVSIITIRGTEAFDTVDWLQDIDLFFESVALDLFGTFTPFLSLWNQVLSHDLFALSSYLEQMLPHDEGRHFYIPIIRLARALKKSGRRVIIVGHSLAGALAKISGVSAQVPAVSFSGPGIFQTARKHSVPVEEFERFVVNVVPSFDVVPQIGMSSGLQINFHCPESEPHLCHMLTVTICKLIDSCGHLHPQKDFVACSKH